MALYFVIKRNEFFPPGAYLKTSGMGLVRELVQDKSGGPTGKEVGMALPLKDVRGAVVRIQETGMDEEYGK